MKKTKYILLSVAIGITYLLLSVTIPVIIDKSSFLLSPISEFAHMVSALLRFPTFYKEYQLLKEKQFDLDFYKHYISTLRKENKELRSLLGMPQKRGFKKIFADVLVEPVGNSDFFYINVGEDKGIKEGYGVVLPGYVVCGRILEVYKHCSKVAYPWNINFSVAGIDENSREEGIVVGRGFGLLEFAFLNFDSLVEKGDVLRTSTLSSFFPAGCLIGEIESFNCNLNNSQCSAEVTPCIKGMVFYRVIVLLPEAQLEVLK